MDELVLDSLKVAAEPVWADSLAALKTMIATNQSQSALLSNNIWMMVSSALVFIMHLGFSTVETGFTQAKNSVSVLFKNTLTVAIGLVTYAIMGFSLMYPGAFNGFFGFAGWGLPIPENGLSPEYANTGYTYWTDFLFQGMFCATCATIVSGAVAERIKLSSYLIFTALYTGILYPIVGSWKWGKGFLDGLETPFYDFAGSTLVHSVGGWGALIGAIIVGPRIGKFVNGEIKSFPGVSIPLATIGVFMLWLGWFGFNGGSVLSADPALTSLVLVNTCLAGATGAIGGVIMAGIVFKRYDFGMALNGILAGLVGITAGADQMSWQESLIIGLIAGCLVVLAVVMFDKLKIDDPVGAISVHLVCGIFGTLVVGIFGAKAGIPQLVSQLIGIGAVGLASVVFSLAVFLGLKYTLGVRVTELHEREGLDSHKHGIRGYSIVFDE